MLLPMNNSSSQTFQAMSVDKVANLIPNPQLRPLLDNIKINNRKHKELQELQAPKKLGRDVDIILGIAYKSIHPEVVHTLPSGLQILRSKFLPATKDETCYIGGNIGAQSTLQ